MRMRRSSNEVMRMRSALMLTRLNTAQTKMCRALFCCWNCACALLISRNFFIISGKIGQKTEFMSARPDHQNVKKIRKFFLVKIIVSKVILPFSYLHQDSELNGKLTLYFDLVFLCSNFMLKLAVLYLFCLLFRVFEKSKHFRNTGLCKGILTTITAFA